jgi:hypothetical protein
MLTEVLTISALIGGSTVLVLFAKNKYQPEIEKVWENRKNNGEGYQIYSTQQNKKEEYEERRSVQVTTHRDPRPVSKPLGISLDSPSF